MKRCRIPRNRWLCLYCEFQAVFQRHKTEFSRSVGVFLIIFFLLQYLYVELATKERPHHHADGQTQAFTHARNVKDMISEVKSRFLICCHSAELFRSFISNFSGNSKAQTCLAFVCFSLSCTLVPHFLCEMKHSENVLGFYKTSSFCRLANTSKIAMTTLSFCCFS